MRSLLFAAALLAALPAMAAQDNVRVKQYANLTSTNTLNLLEGVALNATESTRTIELATYGWSKLVVGVFFTQSAASTVTATFSCSRDGTNYASKTTRACTSGACGVYPMVDTWTTGASGNIELEYDTTGCRSAKIVFGGAGAGASDLVDVQATSTVGL